GRVLAVLEQVPHRGRSIDPPDCQRGIGLPLRQVLSFVRADKQITSLAQFVAQNGEPGGSVLLQFRTEQGKLLRVGIQEQVGQQLWLIGSVIGQDACRKRSLGIRSFPVEVYFGQRRH